MNVLRLESDQKLLKELKSDTIRIISLCDQIVPIKKLVVNHDILELTLSLREKFRESFDLAVTVEEKQLNLDRDALLDLRRNTSELFVYHGTFLPRPDFTPHYISKVNRLLNLYGFSFPSLPG